MIRSKQPTCYISCHVEDDEGYIVWNEAVFPELFNAGWRWESPGIYDYLEFPFGRKHHRKIDWIARHVHKADLFIANISSSQIDTYYELGLAQGWGKPSIVLAQSGIPRYFGADNVFRVIPYEINQPALSGVRKIVRTILRNLFTQQYSLRDPLLDSIVPRKTTISIEMFRRDIPPAQSFSYVYKLIDSLQGISNIDDLSLEHVKIGSLGAWISSSMEAIASIIDKILYFIPECKIRNAKSVKIYADTARILAEAEKLRAEANEIRMYTERQNLISFIETMKHFQEVGPSKVTIGGQIFFKSDGEGSVEIGVPKNMDKMGRRDVGPRGSSET